MARAKGFRSGRKKCQREVICRRRQACLHAGCEIGFSINGIRACIGLKCESLGSKKHREINAVRRRMKRGSSLARCKVKGYLIPCVPAVGRVLRCFSSQSTSVEPWFQVEPRHGFHRQWCKASHPRSSDRAGRGCRMNLRHSRVGAFRIDRAFGQGAGVLQVRGPVSGVRGLGID